MRVWMHPTFVGTPSPFPPPHPGASSKSPHPSLSGHICIHWPPCPHQGESWGLGKANLATLDSSESKRTGPASSGPAPPLTRPATLGK